jgi:hypothetical protein
VRVARVKVKVDPQRMGPAKRSRLP